ncbi:hypothetical protein [Streptomyces hebeiensis]
MGAGTALRLTRTAVFAVVCVSLSGLGHALRSPAPLSPSVLALASLAAGWAGWWLTGRDRGARAVAGVCAAGQILLHALFTWAHAFPSADAQQAMGGASGGSHAPMTMAHAQAGTGDGPVDLMALVTAFASAFDGHALPPGMAAAHMVAGALCGWWLWRGEAAVHQLGRCLAVFVAAPLLLAWRPLSLARTVPPRPRVRAPRRPSRRPRHLVVLCAAARRGPPLLPSA